MEKELYHKIQACWQVNKSQSCLDLMLKSLCVVLNINGRKRLRSQPLQRRKRNNINYLNYSLQITKVLLFLISLHLVNEINDENHLVDFILMGIILRISIYFYNLHFKNLFLNTLFYLMNWVIRHFLFRLRWGLNYIVG